MLKESLRVSKKNIEKNKDYTLKTLNAPPAWCSSRARLLDHAGGASLDKGEKRGKKKEKEKEEKGEGKKKRGGKGGAGPDFQRRNLSPVLPLPQQ